MDWNLQSLCQCVCSWMYILIYESYWVVLVCSGCRIIVWIASSNNTSLYRQSHYLNEAVELFLCNSWVITVDCLSSASAEWFCQIVFIGCSELWRVNQLPSVMCMFCFCSRHLSALLNSCAWRFTECKHQVIILHFIFVNISSLPSWILWCEVFLNTCEFVSSLTIIHWIKYTIHCYCICYVCNIVTVILWHHCNNYYYLGFVVCDNIILIMFKDAMPQCSHAVSS